MSETIDTPYTEEDIKDLRASGHWPAEEPVVEEIEQGDAEPDDDEGPAIVVPA